MKKYKGLIIGIVVLILLLAVYIVIKNLNLDEEEQEEETTETVFEIDGADISKLQIVSGENTFQFSHQDDTWSYSQDSSFPLSESVILDKVSYVTSVSSSRTIENPENLEDYGLETPEVTVTITDTDGEETTLALGATNEAVSGCYMSLNEDTSKIYLVDTSMKTNLEFELSDLAEKEEIPSITGGTIISVAIQKTEGTARLYQDSSSETGWTFADTDGSTVPADSSLVSTYTSNFSTLAWTNYVTYDLSDLGSYGLDNPTVITVDYQVEEEAEDTGSDDTESDAAEDSSENEESDADEASESDTEESTVTVDKQMVMLLGNKTEDGTYYYGKLQDDSCIYTIAATTIEGITEVEKTDFLSTKVADYSFADLDSVTFTRNGQNYIASKETTEVEDEDGETTEETKYMINEKEIETTDFNSFYNLITSMTWQSQDENAQPSGEADLSINFYKEGGTDVTVEYYSYDTNFYLVVDSKGNHMLVNKMDVRELLEAFDTAMEELDQ